MENLEEMRGKFENILWKLWKNCPKIYQVRENVQKNFENIARSSSRRNKKQIL